jgi:hypothetical protein
MEIRINNKQYHLSYTYTFPERISKLKKSNSIKIEFECDKNIEPEYNDLFIVSKSNLYHWVFTNCKIINKEYTIKEYSFGNKKVEYIIIEFTFDKVYGSHNKTLIDREIKLNKLLS